MANDNIGHILCPMSNTLAAVRRDCRGKLYYHSNAGKVTPNLPSGQEWMRSNAQLWPSANVPPPNVSVTQLMTGAPPQIVIKKALTDAPEIKPEKTPEKLPPQPVNKKSALSILNSHFSGEGE
jgi:hypothetical protein